MGIPHDLAHDTPQDIYHVVSADHTDIKWLKAFAYGLLSLCGLLLTLLTPAVYGLHNAIDELRLEVARLQVADKENKLVNDLILGRLNLNTVPIGKGTLENKYLVEKVNQHHATKDCHFQSIR